MRGVPIPLPPSRYARAGEGWGIGGKQMESHRPFRKSGGTPGPGCRRRISRPLTSLTDRYSATVARAKGKPSAQTVSASTGARVRG